MGRKLHSLIKRNPGNPRLCKHLPGPNTPCCSLRFPVLLLSKAFQLLLLFPLFGKKVLPLLIFLNLKLQKQTLPVRRPLLPFPANPASVLYALISQNLGFQLLQNLLVRYKFLIPLRQFIPFLNPEVSGLLFPLFQLFKLCLPLHRCRQTAGSLCCCLIIPPLHLFLLLKRLDSLGNLLAPLPDFPGNVIDSLYRFFSHLLHCLSVELKLHNCLEALHFLPVLLYLAPKVLHTALILPYPSVRPHQIFPGFLCLILPFLPLAFQFFLTVTVIQQPPGDLIQIRLLQTVKLHFKQIFPLLPLFSQPSLLNLLLPQLLQPCLILLQSQF